MIMRESRQKKVRTERHSCSSRSGCFMGPGKGIGVEDEGRNLTAIQEVMCMWGAKLKFEK